MILTNVVSLLHKGVKYGTLNSELWFWKPVIKAGICLLMFGFQVQVSSQDIDPRAYVRIPVKTYFFSSSFAFSDGEVVTDPALPVQDIKAQVQSATAAVSHGFGFFGMSSQVLVAVPYSWAQVSGSVGEELKEISRSGLADMRVRWSVLFYGAPAATVQELRTAERKTVVGASLNMILPTGQFYPDKLINIGTNRWSFRPEIALSQPLAKRWLLDIYTGVWLFTNNGQFYPGEALRSQNPMGTFQGHVSYNISPAFWIAFNSTFYVGGESQINGVASDDRQSNTRLGITTVFPTGKFSSLRLAASMGAIVRVGQDFRTLSIGWQKVWLHGVNKPK